MNKIHKLPQELIDLIAAGEVVERPASVVKELMENSIDAGSTRVIVKIKDSGNSLIEVSDDGIGMNREDALLAFVQHATSKINNINDLDNINTLGFRGEALASISSVSELALIDTKVENEKGITVKRVDNRIEDSESLKVDRGTTIQIVNLFNKVPARKKFLKSDNVEFKHISTTFINTCLPFLNIHFELWHNDKVIYRLTKVNTFLDRVFEVWGKNISSNLFEGFYANNDIQIKAYLGSTSIGRRSNDLQYLFVNNRAVSNKTVYSAAIEGYRGFLHRDLKPVYLFFIDIDPSLVDVNIHPRKLEVRFNDSSEIFRNIYTLTKKKLEEESKSLFKSNILDNVNDVSNDLKESSIKNSEDKFISSDSNPTNYSRLNKVGNGVYYSKGKGSVKDAIDFSRVLIENKNDFNYLLSNNEDTNSFKGVENESNSILNGLTSFKPFQLFNTYILIEKGSSILFIDQHAASEKINFEKIYRSLGKINTKPLLVPEVIELKTSEKNIVLDSINKLKDIGIVIEDFGFNSIKVLEIPESLNNLDVNEYIDKILDSDGDISKSYERDKSDYPNLTSEMYLLLATTACHGSIRAGQVLNDIEMKNIVNDLLKLDKPNNCPHGRPVMWVLERYDLEKNFNRKI